MATFNKKPPLHLDDDKMILRGPVGIAVSFMISIDSWNCHWRCASFSTAHLHEKR